MSLSTILGLSDVILDKNKTSLYSHNHLINRIGGIDSHSIYDDV